MNREYEIIILIYLDLVQKNVVLTKLLLLDQHLDIRVHSHLRRVLWVDAAEHRLREQSLVCSVLA